MFRQAAQGPVVEWLKEELGADVVDGMLQAVEDAKAKYGY